MSDLDWVGAEVGLRGVAHVFAGLRKQPNSLWYQDGAVAGTGNKALEKAAEIGRIGAYTRLIEAQTRQIQAQTRQIEAQTNFVREMNRYQELTRGNATWWREIGAPPIR